MSSRSDRRKARRLARHYWIVSGGDRAKAEEMLRADPSVSNIDPQTLLILLQIAFKLWQWWSEQNTSEPPQIPAADEPIDYEGNDDE